MRLIYPNHAKGTEYVLISVHREATPHGWDKIVLTYTLQETYRDPARGNPTSLTITMAEMDLAHINRKHDYHA